VILILKFTAGSSGSVLKSIYEMSEDKGLSFAFIAAI
jgi:hypothetical protein